MPTKVQTVVFRSFVVPADADLTVRYGPAWDNELACAYSGNHEWSVDVPVPVPADRVEFKFLWRGADDVGSDPYCVGDNLVLEIADQAGGTPLVFDDRRVRFAPRDRLMVENPAPALQLVSRPLSPPSAPTGRTYDVIIIGTGAGGGTLGYQMAAGKHDNGKPYSILMLEAGSYLLPVHAGDMPRRALNSTSTVDHGLWDLWWENQVRRVHPWGELSLTEGLYFGGKMSFWGALAPRMRPWEFADWPPPIADELGARWYAEAEDLLRVSRSSGNLQIAVLDALKANGVLDDYEHEPAPLAAQNLAPAIGAVPAGVFSTAELLIARKLETKSPGPYDNLTILLNHRVTKIDPTGVTAYDGLVDRERTFGLNPGGVVVLAAGTLGSPAIIQNSDLALPNKDLVGRGLTDHAIYSVGFTIDANAAPWYQPKENSVILSRHRTEALDGSGRPASSWNVKFELNANLSLSRYSDKDIFDRLTSGGQMPCEVVFLLESPLIEGNTLQVRPAVPGDLPQIDVKVAPVVQDRTAALDKVADLFIGAVKGTRVSASYSKIGGVSHEVGTLRMERAGNNRPGVVDRDLKLEGYENLYVCDLSVFPSSPAANPTLTLAALALRLADHLKGILK